MFMFYHCPNSITLCGRTSHANFAEHTFGESRIFRELFPCITSICGLKQTTSGATTRHAECISGSLPQCGIKHAWIMRISLNVNRSGRIPECSGSFQDQCPTRPTIRGFIYSAFRICSENSTHRCDKHFIRIIGMNGNLGDIPKAFW